MNEELIEALAEESIETLQAWQSEALQAVKAGDYITSASTGGGVQYAKARAISPVNWLAAVRQAIKRKLNPGTVPTVGQCSVVMFTHSRA